MITMCPRLSVGLGTASAQPHPFHAHARQQGDVGPRLRGTLPKVRSLVSTRHAGCQRGGGARVLLATVAFRTVPDLFFVLVAAQ